MSGATDDGGEDSTWGVVTGESGFAHTGSVVNNECGDFIIHGWTVKPNKEKQTNRLIPNKVSHPPSSWLRRPWHSALSLPVDFIACRSPDEPLGGAVDAHSDRADKRKWRCILLLPYKGMVRFWAALRLPAPWRGAKAAEHGERNGQRDCYQTGRASHSFLRFTCPAATSLLRH